MFSLLGSHAPRLYEIKKRKALSLKLSRSDPFVCALLVYVHPFTYIYMVYVHRTYPSGKQMFKPYWPIPVPMTMGPSCQGRLPPPNSVEEREENACEQGAPPQS